jgi:hypothetical protein
MELRTWLLFTLLLQAGSPEPRAGIAGSVVRADTGAGIPGAQIDLIKFTEAPSADPYTNSLITVTGNARGQFAVPSLPPGTYRLFATRNGFARSEYGQRTPNGRGVFLTIAAGQQLKDITLRLQPAGTITGRVTGHDGEPLTGFSVELLRATYDSTGARVFRPNLTARTDDRGEYRIFWITPGRYYVSVNPLSNREEEFDLSRQILLQAGHAGGPPVDGLANFGFINPNQTFSKDGYVITYYPNTLNVASAQIIDIRPGGELGGINIQLLQQPVARIRGRVVTATGEPAREGEVGVRSSAGERFYGGIGSDSNFEISNVTPGTYNLFAQSAGGQAAAQIQVTGSDIDNVLLTTSPGVTVTGRLQIEGGVPPSEVPGFGRPRIELGTGDTETGRIRGDDGTFRIADVFPNDYWVNVVNLPPRTYLKEVSTAGTDLFRAPLRVSNNTPISLEIVIGRNPGKLEGIVVDQQQQPVADVEVTLIPDQPRERHELYRKSQTDRNGRFVIDEIVPGNYKVFSWEDLEPFSYFDPEVLKQYEQRGTPVRIPEGASASVNIRLIAVAGGLEAR